MYNIVNVDLFDALETDVNYFQTYGSVYVMGDLKAGYGYVMIVLYMTKI